MMHEFSGITDNTRGYVCIIIGGNVSSNSSTDDNVSDNAECQNYTGIIIAVLIYSIIVLALYALLQRRANKHKEIFHGFLGIPVPVNLIHETKDRWVYAIAFGAITGDILYLILEGNSLSSNGTVGGSIWRGILLLIIMMIFPLVYFALFASIHGPLQIVSHVIGFIYVLLLFIQLTLSCSCDNALDDTTSPGILRNTKRAILYSRCIPIGICYVIIGAFFVWRGVRATVYLITGSPFPPRQTVSHHIGHVKRLLNKPPQTVPSNRLFAIVQPYLYQWDPYFKFSVRIISAGVVIVLGLLLLTFELVNLLIIMAKFLEVIVYHNLGLDVGFVNAVVGLSYFFGIMIPLVCYAIIVIGFITSLASYKRQCKLLWKGDRSFLPAKKKSTARILLSSVHFFGFQVAMVIWAWMLYSVIFTLILFGILMFIILLALSDAIRDWVVKRFVLFITSFIMGYIIYYAQLFFIKYTFVSKGEKQKKPSQQNSYSINDLIRSTAHNNNIYQTAGHGEIVLVDNRRLFHLFTFFFIFYYMLIGFFKAIRRVFISAALNLFYLSRLDTPLTIKGWEFFDKAYVSYIAILKVDAAYNNPVMNVFVYLMSSIIEAKSVRNNSHPIFPVSVIEKITVVNHYTHTLSVPLVVEHNNGIIISRAKKRWHLAYTLVCNPNLIVLRRRDQGMDDNKDPTKDIGYLYPAADGDNDGELGMPLNEDDSTKL